MRLMTPTDECSPCLIGRGRTTGFRPASPGSGTLSCRSVLGWSDGAQKSAVR